MNNCGSDILIALAMALKKKRKIVKESCRSITYRLEKGTRESTQDLIEISDDYHIFLGMGEELHQNLVRLV